MTTSSLSEQIAEEAARLSPEDQQRALDFVRALANGRRTIALSSPDNLLRFSGAIPREDLDEMERLIEERCENIDDAE